MSLFVRCDDCLKEVPAEFVVGEGWGSPPDWSVIRRHEVGDVPPHAEVEYDICPVCTARYRATVVVEE